MIVNYTKSNPILKSGKLPMTFIGNMMSNLIDFISSTQDLIINIKCQEIPNQHIETRDYQLVITSKNTLNRRIAEESVISMAIGKITRKELLVRKPVNFLKKAGLFDDI